MAIVRWAQRAQDDLHEVYHFIARDSPRAAQAIACVMFMVSHWLFAGLVGATDLARPIRIGVLNASWGPTPGVVGLRDGLVALGYREDVDFVLGVRFTQGDTNALPAAAQQLVKYGVDLIVAGEDASTKAAQQATTELPIVFIGVANPEGLGSVESFARPGGNVTGVANMELHLGPKRLQVFQEVVPGLKRVLFPYNAADDYAVRMASVYREAGRRLGIELIEKPVRTEAEAQAALAKIHKGEVDGILAPWSTALNIFGFIMETEAQQAIPAMYGGSFFPERGGLTSYGRDAYETGRHAARLVDKILKGAKPGDVPVEVNSQIEFVLNLKTAKKLGLTIAPEVLYRADRLVR